MYYSAIGLLAAMILLIENQDIFLNRNRAFDKPAWKVYKRFLAAVFVYYITDIFWGILESLKLSKLLFADTSVYFIAMAFGILFWTQYTVIYMEEKKTFGRFMIYAGRILAAAVAALVCINIFMPILFTVDDQCVYTALKSRYIILTVQILLLLVISVYAFVSFLRYRSQKRLKYRTFALFGLIMALFLFAQLWFPYLPLYAIAYMLGTCLLRAFVIGDEKESYRLDLEEATRIAELKQSINCLMDNMPALSFSKDAKTGVYLACNQSFADYAKKQSPDDVAGLTDFDIFDQATAEHFVKDDRIALGMDKPYILLEDVPDAAGNPRQFETTKLKFYDANGRMCLLGMCVDVTEMEKIRKENEQAKAAYQHALNTSVIFESIISALSDDYFDLYYVDLQNETYVEYGSKTGSEHIINETHGTDFFNAARESTRKYIYKEDQAGFIKALNKENMLTEIKRHGTFILQYRLMIDGAPEYVNMKATCLNGDYDHMIIGINNIDAQIKDRIAAQRTSEERKAYQRLSALTGNLLVFFIVDPENENYTEYNASEKYEDLGIAKQGENFFKASHENSLRTVHPEDLEMFRSLVTMKNVMETIRRDGVFVLDYRLLSGGILTYVRLKAAQVNEDGKDRLIIGLMDIDAQVRQEQEYENNLYVANKKATRDSLTGVKNKHAYVDAEELLNEKIANDEDVSFAIVVCDINDLKIVNDTEGHKKGDLLIRKACSAICGIFKCSPVFRIGGDEFAVICQGYDYDHIDELMEKMNDINLRNKKDGDVLIACGMARYKSDSSVEAVFERADQLMYEHKAQIKS